MRRIPVFLLLVLLLAAPAGAQEASPVAITSPQAGQALQGIVTVTGTTQVDGFRSAELSFAYPGDPTGTWFLIAALDRPVSNGPLTPWDTTGLSDGEYVLRLRVELQDGLSLEVQVPGLRVRNYTPVETATPEPTVPPPPAVETLPPTALPTFTPAPPPAPTALPGNPVEIVPSQVYASLASGALFTALSFIVFGLFLWIRRRLRYE